MREFQLVSVDDHILEPPHLWQSRLPQRYRDIGPRVVTIATTADNPAIPDKHKLFLVEGEERSLQFWAYEDLLIPSAGLAAAISKRPEEYSVDPMSFEEMRPGCYDPAARIPDLDVDGVIASLCFPSFGRLCGQTFAEAKDKELSLLCVRAYNDFIFDEWCAAAPGRFIPMCVLPLWDVDLAVAELERVAALGARAISFSENPAKLGLPSIHRADNYWDPLFAAAAAADIPLCLHIGSSSSMISTAADAPMSVFVALAPINAQITLMDWLLSGVVLRHPRLKIVLSEGGIGWIPYLLERADYVWQRQRVWTNSPLTDVPSAYFRENFYGCFIDDAHGAANIHEIGVDRCMIEVDYPHSDSTWPNSVETATKHLSTLSDSELYQVTRGNAERVFRFQPSGIGQL